MRFTIFSTLGLAVTAAATAAIPAEEVISQIHAMTELSYEANSIAEQITAASVNHKAPQVLHDFQQIVDLAEESIEEMSPRPDTDTNISTKVSTNETETKTETKKRQEVAAYTEEQQKAICAAFRELVQIDQEILRVLIDKNNVIHRTQFAAPIAAVLRQLEAVVDVLALQILEQVPACGEDLARNLQSLDQGIEETVEAYE